MKPSKKLATLSSKLLLGASLLFVIASTTAKADNIDVPFLNNIQTAAQNIQTAVQTIAQYITQYLTNLSTAALSWMNADNTSGNAPDWSTQWANSQNWLASLGSQGTSAEQNIYGMQQNILNTFFNLPNSDNATNINDIAYPSMLQQPLINPDPRGNTVNPAMNYLNNAAGLNIGIIAPSANFRGTPQARNNYINFYNTTTAVQTYNLFALSHLYQDSQNYAASWPWRQQLLTQSSDSGWFAAVITNNLGWVLRQILLYSSQNYILMDQLVQINKQIAATLAMSNTLQISNNYLQANTLLQQAQGISPS